MSSTKRSGDQEPSLRTQTKTLKLYSPHAKQLEFHNLRTRFRVAAWGRQSGKSTACLNDIARAMWKNPNTTYWFISPTFDQARKQYRRFVGMMRPCWQVLLKKNQSELRVKLINNSSVEFKSGETFNNLRGEALHGCAIDEVRDQNPDLYKLVVRPMLTTTRGWCTFISTPNGFDAFFDLAERAKVNRNWSYMHAPSTANPLFTAQELDEAKEDMSQAEFDQEILAEFRDLTRGKTYGAYGEWNEASSSPFATDGGIFSLHLDTYVCMDFNVAPMAWTLGQKALKDFYAFDMVYIERTVMGTFEAAQVLVDKLKGYGINHVILIGDASGKATKTSASGETDYTIVCAAIHNAGMTYENITPEGNPPIKDRVNCFNSHLKSADGSVHFWLHPKNCAPLRKDMQRVTWKPGTGKLFEGTDGSLTHASDGVGYWIHATDPLTLFEDSFDIEVV